MANKAFSLSPNTLLRPSILDCSAAQSFDTLFYPICKRLFAGLASSRPFFANKFFDELYYSCYSLLQYYHLKTFGATISERFYGMKRESLQADRPQLKMRGKELLLSMLTVCLMPYINQKLVQKMDDSAVESDETGRNKAMKKVMTLIKCIKAIWQGSDLIQILRYQAGSTNVISMAYLLPGVKLVYNTDEPPGERSFGEILSNLIKIGIFFYQFLQMVPIVTSSAVGQSRKLVEPPSQMKGKTEEKDTDSRDGNNCPLCGGRIRVETVLSTSGYVFCFPCISSYLMKNGHCPVTKLPSNLDNLITIYPPT